jgi:hypothetical protein
MKTVAVLFARADSVYKTLPGCDVYDIDRDARTYSGALPVVAHPPCRSWGRLRAFARPRHDERELALFAVDRVRVLGGVLEHPAGSTLWQATGMPRPGCRDRDAARGYTIAVHQNEFGHRAVKPTWLYVCGCEPGDLPDLPLLLGRASHVIAQMRTRRDGTRIRKSDQGWRPEVSKAEREHTPVALAKFLVATALKTSR